MIRDKKEMLNFEEVDKIETFFGLNKGMILGRGINRIIMEFKSEPTKYIQLAYLTN